jgi:hypothetical protein
MNQYHDARPESTLAVMAGRMPPNETGDNDGREKGEIGKARRQQRIEVEPQHQGDGDHGERCDLADQHA